LVPAQSDRVTFYLHLQVRLLDAGYSSDENKVITSTEHIHWGITAAPARAGCQPSARTERVQGLLQAHKLIKRVRKHCHLFTPSCAAHRQEACNAPDCRVVSRADPLDGGLALPDHECHGNYETERRPSRGLGCWRNLASAPYGWWDDVGRRSPTSSRPWLRENPPGEQDSLDEGWGRWLDRPPRGLPTLIPESRLR
jgi:hypothetical protein